MNDKKAKVLKDEQVEGVAGGFLNEPVAQDLEAYDNFGDNPTIGKFEVSKAVFPKADSTHDIKPIDK